MYSSEVSVFETDIFSNSCALQDERLKIRVKINIFFIFRVFGQNIAQRAGAWRRSGLR
jgi:hypothetical protein